MRKKFICLILGVVLCCSLFAGCTLIEHNDEKDARQVIAVIKDIEDTSNGITYKSSPKYIYKSDLIRYRNSYAQQYMQSYNMTLQQATEALFDELITRELLLIEVERLTTQKIIEITQKDRNDIQRSVYATIDNQITTLRNEILSDFGEGVTSSDSSEDSTTTTYPVPETPEEEEDYSDYKFDENGKIVTEPKQQQAIDADGNLMFKKLDDGTDDESQPIMITVQVPVYKVWEPEKENYPAMYGSENEKSLDREAVRRFISLVKQIADADFKATKEDKAKFKKAADEIDNIINTEGIEAVYPKLGENYLIEYVIGKSAEQSVLINKLRDYIVGEVQVKDEEIASSYQDRLKIQIEAYRDNQEAYQKAVSDDVSSVLYYRDDSYFFVKHILLKFSDEQTAALTAYKNDPLNATNDYTDYRDNQVVNETVVYPHINGEDDLRHPTTVPQVYDEIYGAMARLSSNPKEAERKFDEFIYKYNVDPGAFGYGKSYAVKRGDEDTFSGWVEEFYRGAMELYENYKVGDMLPKMVVTDYGVHLMYLSKVVVPDTTLGLNDYYTPAGYQSVRESFESTIRNTKENSKFTSWQNERITYYREKTGVVKTYEKRFKNLYETK